jgi:hypothetical protein
MGWAGHVACMGERRGVYRVMVGNTLFMTEVSSVNYFDKRVSTTLPTMTRYHHMPHETNFPKFVLVRITKIPSKTYPPYDETKTSNRYLLMTMASTSV